MKKMSFGDSQGKASRQKLLLVSQFIMAFGFTSGILEKYALEVVVLVVVVLVVVVLEVVVLVVGVAIIILLFHFYLIV
jgi:hypothetical protein